MRPGSDRALLSALWFATIALLSVVLWLHPLKIVGSGILLFIVLPTISAAISAGLLDGHILDPTRTITLRQSLLRGIAVAVGAFFIFALLYAVALPFAERGWSIGQSSGLFLLTATFGMLFGIPIILIGGYWAARRYIGSAASSIWSCCRGNHRKNFVLWAALMDLWFRTSTISAYCH